MHSKSIIKQHLSQEAYACSNSKPQGLESIFKEEPLKTDRATGTRPLLSPKGGFEKGRSGEKVSLLQRARTAFRACHRHRYYYYY